MENPGLLSECRDDHLLAGGDVSNDNLFPFLRAGKFIERDAVGADEQARYGADEWPVICPFHSPAMGGHG
jgi:hypothetical protein